DQPVEAACVEVQFVAIGGVGRVAMGSGRVDEVEVVIRVQGAVAVFDGESVVGGVGLVLAGQPGQDVACGEAGDEVVVVAAGDTGRRRVVDDEHGGGDGAPVACRVECADADVVDPDG